VSARILEGTSLAAKRFEKLKPRLALLKKNGVTPQLAIILIGSDPASLTYVGVKQERAKEIGIDAKLYHMPENVSQGEVERLIAQLNSDATVHGIIVQLPAPKEWNIDQLVQTIVAEKDVDALGSQRFFNHPTPQAILALLTAHNISLKGKRVALIGYGRLVGRPLSKLFESMGIAHTVYSPQHGNVDQCCLKEDIVISATGKKVITPDKIRPGAIVINAAEDLNFDDIKEVAGALTPPKGGVGPLTVALLLENVVLAASRQTRGKQ
jgi:methylenetetrahydrofolate dehydrogenase (NADP+)/methenyltetrahydrofolate cyclohydrolase